MAIKYKFQLSAVSSLDYNPETGGLEFEGQVVGENLLKRLAFIFSLINEISTHAVANVPVSVRAEAERVVTNALLNKLNILNVDGVWQAWIDFETGTGAISVGREDGEFDYAEKVGEETVLHEGIKSNVLGFYRSIVTFAISMNTRAKGSAQQGLALLGKIVRDSRPSI